jgi:hypothetical protein
LKVDVLDPPLLLRTADLCHHDRMAVEITMLSVLRAVPVHGCELK